LLEAGQEVKRELDSEQAELEAGMIEADWRVIDSADEPPPSLDDEADPEE
jgi:hypothetical protein